MNGPGLTRSGLIIPDAGFFEIQNPNPLFKTQTGNPLCAVSCSFIDIHKNIYITAKLDLDKTSLKLSRSAFE